jgi:hypothetical protein
MSRSNLYVGLIHYPVLDKKGEIVTTSVTNLDIHDISRSCHSFGVKKLFLVTPIEPQRKLVSRILNHWERDDANAYNPDRFNALRIVELVDSYHSAINLISEWEGKGPKLITTGAKVTLKDQPLTGLESILKIDKTPIFLVFGTGWGLAPNIEEEADFKLAPILGANPDGYNHLSVRSAVAIYLDRVNELFADNSL